jgi:hypothetical protein
VYSLGFYQLIKEPLKRSSKKKSIYFAIWKVYSILLQYVCKTEYQTVVFQLTMAYQKELIKSEEMLAHNKAEYEKHRDELLHAIATLDYESEITKEGKY